MSNRAEAYPGRPLGSLRAGPSGARVVAPGRCDSWEAVLPAHHLSEGFHPPLEEYLETIQALTEEGTPVIQARLASRLGRSAPSVSEMLDRLSAEGYIERSGRKIALTSQGRKLADSVIRKHRLAERLLVDVIGLPWHKAHQEAGRWEHVISDEVEERLVALLGNPTTCPHGNPIPRSPGLGPRPVSSTPSGGQVSLAQVAAGEEVRLERITEEVELDVGTLKYLDEHGFIPGRSARVRDRGPDGTVSLEVDGRDLELSPSVCQQLFVAAV
jgi:DtxR family Mn-dependent transcriptional regulator